MDSIKSNGTDNTAVPIPSNGHSKSQSIESEDDYAPTGNHVGTKSSPETSPQKSPAMKCLGENILTIATLSGVVLGIALGFGLRSAKTWTKREVMYVNFPGELFLNMLKGLILPLIASSLIAAIGRLDMKLTGKIGGKAVAYYVATTVMAIVLGIILVVSIRPGVGSNMEESLLSEMDKKDTLNEDTLMDLARNLFPPNLVQACIFQYSTILIRPSDLNASDNSSFSTEEMRTWDFKGEWVANTNIMGIVVVSIVFGIALAKMGRQGKALLDVVSVLSDCVMLITKAVIWLSPVGVLFLVAAKIMEMEDLALLASQVGLYGITVLAGILIHGFIVLPALFFLLTRKNPYKFALNMGQALATAFGTSSSSATLPITITCLEEKNKIDHRVSRFVLPIGATINMDGTALYEAVAAIFIAQTRGVSLTIGNIIAISITATAASVGAAGIPQAGLVTMVMVLNVVGLPAEDVSLIIIVDWILDRFRTMINVLGDAFGAGIVSHFSENDLVEISNYDANVEMTVL